MQTPTNTTFSIATVVLLLAGCQPNASSGSSTDKDGPFSYVYGDDVAQKSDFVIGVGACIMDIMQPGFPDDQARKDAIACVSALNSESVTDLESRLHDAEGMRQLAVDEGYEYTGPAVRPGSAQAILDKTAAAAKGACIDLVDLSDESKQLQCQLIVQLAIAYQLAGTVYEDQDSADQLLPKSPRPEIQVCTAAYDVATEYDGPTHEMLQAKFTWIDCVDEVNKDTVYQDLVGEDDGDPGAQNQWQIIRFALDQITEDTAQFCDLMVAVSDSPEGSISQLYRSDCTGSVETFVTLAIDVIRDTDQPPPAASE